MKRLRYVTPAAVALFTVYVILGACANSQPSGIRPAAVSGSFYPSDPQKLSLAVEKFLEDSVEISVKKPLALIVPHAGYIYSGQISADAYRQIIGHTYDVVVIIGVNHTSATFRGISLGDYTHFRTPLGDIPVDEKVIAALLSENTDCSRNRAVHIGEHSIEVQLPFIQTILPDARIVPVVIHPAEYEMCARFGRSLAKVLGNRNALIVISTDLSHYPKYEDAVEADKMTLETIASLESARFISLMKDLRTPGLDTRACGQAAILAGTAAAKELGATRAVVASYANSADVAIGDPSRVVGYGAVILSSGNAGSDTSALNRTAPPPEPSPLEDPEKRVLLGFARESIERYLSTQTLPLARNFPDRMKYPQGAFVTLKKEGHLRGCVGNLSGNSELGKTVGAMALQAAFNDRRFAPVKLDELADLEIEISVLTPMKPIASPREIVIGRDGVLLSKSGSSAVFLPQVAPENNWDRTEMLQNLCKKGGLPAECWKDNAHFQVFQADVFDERQFD